MRTSGSGGDVYVAAEPEVLFFCVGVGWLCSADLRTYRDSAISMTGHASIGFQRRSTVLIPRRYEADHGVTLVAE